MIHRKDVIFMHDRKKLVIIIAVSIMGEFL